jgi:hypothetical protein
MQFAPALLLSLVLCLPATTNSKGGHGGESHAFRSHITQITKMAACSLSPNTSDLPEIFGQVIPTIALLRCEASKSGSE